MKHFKFDKFIKDIVKREDEKREQLKVYAENHEDLPQRKYNKLYRELPQNKIVYNAQNPKNSKSKK